MVGARFSINIPNIQIRIYLAYNMRNTRQIFSYKREEGKADPKICYILYYYTILYTYTTIIYIKKHMRDIRDEYLFNNIFYKIFFYI